jgi:hypothetical protein
MMKAMRGCIVATAVAATLTGCVTFGQMDKGLASLVGEPLDTAVNVLGYPSGERTIAGRHLVQWGRSSQGFMPVVNTAQSFGTVTANGGWGTYSGTTTSTSYVPISYNCSITVQVDTADRISGYQYNGNLGGCGAYIKRLNRYRKTHHG